MAAGGVYTLIQSSARAQRLEGGRAERERQRMQYQQYARQQQRGAETYAHYD